MRIALIAAVAENGVIGRDGDLPWRIPGDLRYFKGVTMGKPLVMGRRTFQSLPRALPGRANIVVSRDPGFDAPGAQLVPDLERALALARAIAERDGACEVMVIGGAEIYRQALPLASRIYLTEVHRPVAGDRHFPELSPGGWREVSRRAGDADGPETPPHEFVVLDRRDEPSSDGA